MNEAEKKFCIGKANIPKWRDVYELYGTEFSHGKLFPVRRTNTKRENQRPCGKVYEDVSEIDEIRNNYGSMLLKCVL